MLTQVVQSLKISSDIQRKELKFLGFTSISIVLFLVSDWIAIINVIILSCSYCFNLHYAEISQGHKHNMHRKKKNSKRTSHLNLSCKQLIFSMLVQEPGHNLRLC